MKIITCFYKCFRMKNNGPGLKHSGVGDCNNCNCENEQKDKCINYLEVCVEEDHDPVV